MTTPFSLFLALRYLKPKRTFVSVITLLSVAGVTIGIASLIVVIAVMTGFGTEFKKAAIGFEPHLVVKSNGGVLRDWERASELSLKTPGITAAAPIVTGPAILEHRGMMMTPQTLGVLLPEHEKIMDLRSMVKRGEFDLEGDKCLLGLDVAVSLDVDVGDVVVLHGTGNLQTIMHELRKAEEKAGDAKSVGEIRELIRPLELKVTGLFQSGRSDYDGNYIILPLQLAQQCYGLDGEVHAVALKTADPYEAEASQRALMRALPESMFVQSWMDTNRQRLEAIATERTMMLCVLMIMVIIAAFSITNTLITVVVQKKREIGILKALGASPGAIMSVFIGQGAVVGILGNIAGVSIGMLVLYFRNPLRRFLAEVFKVDIFNERIYLFTEIPAQITVTDVAVISSAAFVICLVAALIPAFFAARLDPVKALREE